MLPEPTTETVIRARNLGKAYNIYKRPEDRLKQMLWRGRRHFYQEYWALQDVDIDIARGETVGIIGRNGSGKSTFLQMVCGTLTPTRGELTVSGRIAALLELGAAFNPEFTGRENVYLSASVLGLNDRQIDERYDAIAEFAGIGDFIEQPVKVYSSGMYARLAFAVAAHVDAEILIVDEILSVGDAAFVQKCMRFIRRFQANGTLLFVAHDTAAVINLCQRAVWLDNGSVREIGPAKEVCANYAAAMEQEKDNVNTFKIGGSRRPPPDNARLITDPRAEILSNSDKRNKIEVFDFDPDANWFGHRGATIKNVGLTDHDGQPVTSLEGGEEVILTVNCRADDDLERPIVGFFIKDRLGQLLFGDNTYLTYCDAPLAVPAGRSLAAQFRFQMPYMPTGDYSIDVAIAKGTQEDHQQQHWITDAMFFRVHSSHVSRGLVGIPMLEIQFIAE